MIILGEGFIFIQRFNKMRRKSYHNCLDRIHAENKRYYENHKEFRKGYYSYRHA